MTIGRIGLCGLGRMGSAIGERLLTQGASLVVWNRDTSKTSRLSALGADVASSPAELASETEIVLTILFDDRASRDVYLGPAGLLSCGKRGVQFVDMTTVGPDAAIALDHAVHESGNFFLECPVGGTVGPARDGKLLGLVGGSLEALERVRPVLDLLCRRIEHVGPIGMGARLKLAVNLPLLVYWQALNEALGLVVDTTLSADELVSLMADTAGAPAVVKMRAAELGNLLAGKSEPGVGFEASAAAKDLREMVKLARSLSLSAPVAEAAAAAFEAAVPGALAGRDSLTMSSLNWQKAREGRPS